jgi:hypothetical protein
MQTLVVWRETRRLPYQAADMPGEFVGEAKANWANETSMAKIRRATTFY